MFYVRKINGLLESRPESPYMGTDWNEERGWLPYAGTLPLDRLDVGGGVTDENGVIRGGTVVELPAESEPEREPRTFSKLKIHDELSALGLWPTIRTELESSGSYERWMLAQDVREDDPDFAALMSKLSEPIAAQGIDLEELLDKCVMEA